MWNQGRDSQYKKIDRSSYYEETDDNFRIIMTFNRIKLYKLLVEMLGRK